MEEKIIPFKRAYTGVTAPEVRLPEPIRAVDPDCPTCKGMGWLRRNVPLGHPDFGKPVRCQCKTEANMQRIKARTFTWLGSEDADQVRTLESMTFDAFVQSYQPDAYNRSLNWSDMVHREPTSQPNVLSIGSFGTGKTHLASASLNYLRERGIVCLFATAPDLFDALYAANFDAKEHIIGDAAACQVLCLDDLDKLHVKEDGTYQKDMLFKLLNKRYLAHKPTIITTNARADLDRWLDRAVISRLFGNVLAIKVDGQDYRQIAGRDSSRGYRGVQ